MMLSQFQLFKTQTRCYASDKTLLDHYATLNLPTTASKQEIKRAFLDEAKKVHPDKVTHLDEAQRGAAAERFKQLNEAYETLGDAAKRRQYDAQRGVGGSGGIGHGAGIRRQKQFGLVTKRKRTLLWLNVTIVVLVLGMASLRDARQPPSDNARNDGWKRP